MSHQNHRSRRGNTAHRAGATHHVAPPRSPTAQAVAERSPVPGWLFSIVLLLWWTLGYGTVIYSLIEDRGPFTFLLSWQDALFGGSNIIIAAGLAAIVIFLGPLWLVGRLHRLWPASPVLADLNSRMRRATRSRGEIAADARARWAKADTAEKARLARRARNSALVASAAAFALSAAIAIWVHVTADADAGAPLTPIVVSGVQPINLGGASNWVRVTAGMPLRDATLERDYTIRGHAYRDYYTAIVPPGWTPRERIYLLEKNVTSPGDHDVENRPDPPGEIEGELSVAGPRDEIASSFQQHGYDVGPWTGVLRRHFDLDGKIPGEDSAVSWLIWFEGGLFAVIGLIIAAAQHWRLRRVLAGKAL